LSLITLDPATITVPSQVVHDLLDEAEPQMGRACDLIKAESPAIQVVIGRHNYEAQAEYAKRGFTVVILPDDEEVVMRRNLKPSARAG